MNIFVLDTDPAIAASYHCDKHVNKMLVESCQILGSGIWHSHGVTRKKDLAAMDPSVVSRIWKGFPRQTPYGIGYMHHPSTKWARESSDNWKWLCEMALALADQYEIRYKKTCSVRPKIQWFLDNAPSLPSGLTPFAQAMPDHLKRPDAVEAYRLNYAARKSYMATWKSSSPVWWKKYIQIASDLGVIEDRSLPNALKVLGKSLGK